MSFRYTGPKVRPDPVKPHQQPNQVSPNLSRTRRSSDASSIASFHSARFSPEEEERLVSASNEIKGVANAQFAQQDYSSALSTYDRAIAGLPTYLDYEVAVLQSNIAACHLRLDQWKDAVKAAENGMSSLEKMLPMAKPPSVKRTGVNDHDPVRTGGARERSDTKQDSQVVELPEDNDDVANQELLRNLDISDQRKTDVHRIRTKLLLRRARGRYMLGTSPPTPEPKDDKQSSSADSGFSSSWSNLSSAQADYQTLLQTSYFSGLPLSDQKTVRHALAALPPLIERAKEKETAEMMGKLKDLGNLVLKPFGMSTDMFKVTQDPATGGMSLSFDGAGSAK